MSCSTINLAEKFEKKYNISDHTKLSIVKCNIFKELENNENAKIKFKGKQLNIYLNEDDEWINDITKEDWLKKNSEIKNNIKINFKKRNELLYFTLEKYYTESKTELESKDQVEINANTKLLIFKKSYYNYNQKVYFESTLYGRCKI
tara:strand:- start:607 stop:1047 length:441 start_codon:yes stop_codon:yes gene_type:complete